MVEINSPKDVFGNFPALGKADSYFCFIRSWLNESGLDAVLWWETEDKFYKRQICTSDVFSETKSIIDQVKEIDKNSFLAVLGYVDEFKLRSAQSQTEFLHLTHFCDIIAFRCQFGERDYYIEILGGEHASELVNNVLDKIFEANPVLTSGSVE